MNTGALKNQEPLELHDDYSIDFESDFGINLSNDMDFASYSLNNFVENVNNESSFELQTDQDTQDAIKQLEEQLKRYESIPDSVFQSDSIDNLFFPYVSDPHHIQNQKNLNKVSASSSEKLDNTNFPFNLSSPIKDLFQKSFADSKISLNSKSISHSLINNKLFPDDPPNTATGSPDMNSSFLDKSILDIERFANFQIPLPDLKQISHNFDNNIVHSTTSNQPVTIDKDSDLFDSFLLDDYSLIDSFLKKNSKRKDIEDNDFLYHFDKKQKNSEFDQLFKLNSSRLNSSTSQDSSDTKLDKNSILNLPHASSSSNKNLSNSSSVIPEIKKNNPILQPIYKPKYSNSNLRLESDSSKSSKVAFFDDSKDSPFPDNLKKLDSADPPSDNENNQDLYKGPTHFIDISGIPHISFTYTLNGKFLRYTIRCDIEKAPISEIPTSFKLNNILYPKAHCNKADYKGNRWDYENSCNFYGWRLAFLNQEKLAGMRGTLQRAVDSYRNLMTGRKNRRVSKQQKLMQPEFIVGSGPNGLLNYDSRDNTRILSSSKSDNLGNQIDSVSKLSLIDPTKDINFTRKHVISERGETRFLEFRKKHISSKLRDVSETLHESSSSLPKMILVDVYTRNRFDRIRIKADLASIDSATVPEEFQRAHCVYPRALDTAKERYRGALGRWAFEVSCNEIAWKLAWLNKPRLASKRPVMQKCLDAYRWRLPSPPVDLLDCLKSTPEVHTDSQFLALWVPRWGRKQFIDRKFSNENDDKSDETASSSNPKPSKKPVKNLKPNKHIIKKSAENSQFGFDQNNSVIGSIISNNLKVSQNQSILSKDSIQLNSFGQVNQKPVLLSKPQPIGENKDSVNSTSFTPVEIASAVVAAAQAVSGMPKIIQNINNPTFKNADTSNCNVLPLKESTNLNDSSDQFKTDGSYLFDIGDKIHVLTGNMKDGYIVTTTDQYEPGKQIGSVIYPSTDNQNIVGTGMFGSGFKINSLSNINDLNAVSNYLSSLPKIDSLPNSSTSFSNNQKIASKPVDFNPNSNVKNIIPINSNSQFDQNKPSIQTSNTSGNKLKSKPKRLQSKDNICSSSNIPKILTSETGKSADNNNVLIEISAHNKLQNANLDFKPLASNPIINLNPGSDSSSQPTKLSESILPHPVINLGLKSFSMPNGLLPNNLGSVAPGSFVNILKAPTNTLIASSNDKLNTSKAVGQSDQVASIVPKDPESGKISDPPRIAPKAAPQTISETTANISSLSKQPSKKRLSKIKKVAKDNKPAEKLPISSEKVPNLASIAPSIALNVINPFLNTSLLIPKSNAKSSNANKKKPVKASNQASKTTTNTSGNNLFPKPTQQILISNNATNIQPRISNFNQSAAPPTVPAQNVNLTNEVSGAIKPNFQEFSKFFGQQIASTVLNQFPMQPNSFFVQNQNQLQLQYHQIYQAQAQAQAHAQAQAQAQVQAVQAQVQAQMQAQTQTQTQAQAQTQAHTLQTQFQQQQQQLQFQLQMHLQQQQQQLNQQLPNLNQNQNEQINSKKTDDQSQMESKESSQAKNENYSELNLENKNTENQFQLTSQAQIQNQLKQIEMKLNEHSKKIQKKLEPVASNNIFQQLQQHLSHQNQPQLLPTTQPQPMLGNDNIKIATIKQVPGPNSETADNTPKQQGSRQKTEVAKEAASILAEILRNLAAQAVQTKQSSSSQNSKSCLQLNINNTDLSSKLAFNDTKTPNVYTSSDNTSTNNIITTGFKAINNNSTLDNISNAFYSNLIKSNKLPQSSNINSPLLKKISSQPNILSSSISLETPKPDFNKSLLSSKTPPNSNLSAARHRPSSAFQKNENTKSMLHESSSCTNISNSKFFSSTPTKPSDSEVYRVVSGEGSKVSLDSKVQRLESLLHNLQKMSSSNNVEKSNTSLNYNKNLNLLINALSGYPDQQVTDSLKPSTENNNAYQHDQILTPEHASFLTPFSNSKTTPNPATNNKKSDNIIDLIKTNTNTAAIQNIQDPSYHQQLLKNVSDSSSINSSISVNNSDISIRMGKSELKANKDINSDVQESKSLSQQFTPETSRSQTLSSSKNIERLFDLTTPPIQSSSPGHNTSGVRSFGGTGTVSNSPVAGVDEVSALSNIGSCTGRDVELSSSEAQKRLVTQQALIAAFASKLPLEDLIGILSNLASQKASENSKDQLAKAQQLQQFEASSVGDSNNNGGNGGNGKQRVTDASPSASKDRYAP
ncbi:hypothetical protein AYI69_g4766 [Smittium culicis]|uniref:DUF8032 domain-containing protein n=1 Tax=Smittium culicis TaxID=133412 RepID=A0A1R1YAT9_9FUNG|nr:hypothetical protein AYI69_g4766 [Smittium culicis]